ncbi:MAG: septum site-determining protein MinC [Lachnospiraceae bacterium]|nr:septum site-determining protein MinC [Lachnospiraceae bacterium]MCR5766964.1 septum site-determining protein MinC [Lachnospiraceae bacterium]
MDNSVVIKGNKNGITVILDGKMDFELLKEKIAAKFKDSSRILGEYKTAIAFQGRDLTDAEEIEILDIIGKNSDLDIVCVINDDDKTSQAFGNAIDTKLMDVSGNVAVFHKGIIRGGDVVSKDKSIIVLGDVNPNASLSSDGNIIILGSLKGIAQAGASGNRNAFIFALDMQPSQLRIADVIARSADTKDGMFESGPMIAYLDGENICIEPVSKKAVNNIRLTPSIL